MNISISGQEGSSQCFLSSPSSGIFPCIEYLEQSEIFELLDFSIFFITSRDEIASKKKGKNCYVFWKNCLKA